MNHDLHGHLAMMHWNGDGVAQSWPLAAAYLDKACGPGADPSESCRITRANLAEDAARACQQGVVAACR